MWFYWISLFGVAKLPLVSAVRQVVMYSRKGCHLCEIVKETLTKLHRRGGFTWSEIDVDSDEQLRRQFTDEVPVIFIDGRKAFKYRLDEREFLRTYSFGLVSKLMANWIVRNKSATVESKICSKFGAFPRFLGCSGTVEI